MQGTHLYEVDRLVSQDVRLTGSPFQCHGPLVERILGEDVTSDSMHVIEVGIGLIEML